MLLWQIHWFPWLCLCFCISWDFEVSLWSKLPSWHHQVDSCTHPCPEQTNYSLQTGCPDTSSQILHSKTQKPLVSATSLWRVETQRSRAIKLQLLHFMETQNGTRENDYKGRLLGKDKQKSKKLNPLSVLRYVRFLSIYLSFSICISLSPSQYLLAPHLYIHSVSYQLSKFLIYFFSISCNLHQFPAWNPLGSVQQSARTSSVEVPCS